MNEKTIAITIVIVLSMIIIKILFPYIKKIAILLYIGMAYIGNKIKISKDEDNIPDYADPTKGTCHMVKSDWLGLTCDSAYY